MRKTIVVLAACATLVHAQVPARQSEPVDPKKLCKIEGRTVNARTGEPVPRVTLTLMGGAGGGQARSGRSESDGRFLIENIPPGTYRLMGERVGFLRQGYGSRTPGGSGAPLNLSEAQQLKDLEFRLTPQGVIMGQVFDEEGDPLPRSSVAAYPVGNPGSATAASRGMRGGGGGPAGQPSGSSTMANDIGEYRVAGLSPGRYVVMATSQGGGPARGGARGGPMGRGQAGISDEALLPTYYPSTTDSAAAVPIEIMPGQDVGGINITIHRGLLHRIQGRIMGGNPQELQGVSLLLFPRGNGGPAVMGGRGGAQARPDGTFEIVRVQPGSYYILAQRMGRQAGPGLVGKTMVDVTSADVTGLLVPVIEPVSVSGTVKFDDAQQTTVNLQRLTLSLSSLDQLPVGSPAGRVANAGTFKIDAVFPDKYLLNVNGLPEGAYVKSVRQGGQEVIEKGIDLSNARTSAVFDVVLSLKGATLEGTATISDKPATGGYIAVIADPLRPEQPYRNKFATADQDGRFTIKGLAPGGYKVYAFEESMPELTRDPGLARPYERGATKINLDEGATSRVELKALKREDAQ